MFGGGALGNTEGKDCICLGVGLGEEHGRNSIWGGALEGPLKGGAVFDWGISNNSIIINYC